MCEIGGHERDEATNDASGPQDRGSMRLKGTDAGFVPIQLFGVVLLHLEQRIDLALKAANGNQKIVVHGRSLGFRHQVGLDDVVEDDGRLDVDRTSGDIRAGSAE